MYEYYGYYLGSIQKEKEDKIKYGTTDFARSDVEGYAKDVQYQYNMNDEVLIMIKLNKILNEVIGKDKGSDSLPNSKQKNLWV